MQFFPHFRAHGISCEIHHAYGRLYNRVFDRPLVGPLYKTLTRARRAALTLVRPGEVLFSQRTAFPQTAWVERLAKRRGARFILDFDDAIYLGPGGRRSRRRERAFRDAVAAADHCVAGNRHLRDVADAPHKTSVIPTVIDTDRYTPPAQRGGDTVVIGWMGTSGNFPFLERVVPALRAVLRAAPYVSVRIVSNARFEPLAGEPRVEQLRWTAASEIERLRSFDIGLMPLVDGPLTRGKCAFKMIQYMSVGAPVVVSAVGANRDVIADRALGYAVDGFEWEEPLLALVRDEALRASMGAAGRERAVQTYSVRSVLPAYLRLLASMHERGSCDPIESDV